MTLAWKLMVAGVAFAAAAQAQTPNPVSPTSTAPSNFVQRPEYMIAERPTFDPRVCLKFMPSDELQQFFLYRDTDVLLEMVGGGGGGGGNVQRAGGNGGSAAEYLFDKNLRLKRGLYYVRVGSGGGGGRGKRAPADDPADFGRPGLDSQITELGGPWSLTAHGGTGGANDATGNAQGGNGGDIKNNGFVIARGGAGGGRDRSGASGQSPGAGGGGTGIFVAGGGIVGGTGGGGRVMVCPFERGALDRAPERAPGSQSQ